MTKQEFLEELRNALSGEISPEALAESYQYYATYIEDEIRTGKTEEEVLEELGPPMLIARSIIAAQSGDRFADVEYTEDGRVRKARNKSQSNTGSGTKEQKEFHFDSNAWYAKLLFIFVFVLIVIVLFGLLSGLLFIVLHFAIPILLILGVIYLIMYALK